MLDISWIRKNPGSFDEAMLNRNEKPLSSVILDLDLKHRKARRILQQLQTESNSIADAAGILIKNKDTLGLAKLQENAKELRNKIRVAEQNEKEAGDSLHSLLCTIPNIPLACVPVGADPEHNVEVHRSGVLPSSEEISFKQHDEIGEASGFMDFATAVKMSGSKFVLLRGELARLERALGHFMLDLHTQEHGYTEIAPPFLVGSDAAYGTGNLPKFDQDLFQTTNGMWLIPTAEVSLTNMVRDSILAHDELPLRFTALTPCFRSEAGAAGRDTRGMLRLHQFMKVELVSITSPDESKREHERMLNCAEEVLKRLEIPFRTVVLCTGDMGFASCKTYDIEVWLPGQNVYREISSCSNCGDFQARRMAARCRLDGDKKTHFLHTLNGSGVALGRALVAILENYQNEDGSVIVPNVLRPYMKLETIGRNSG